ncbi:MAG: c-type cytochrome [Acidobacteria bacterium]|nr:c-type cytochrome [Acidobacteriota bacterium]
MNSRFLFSLLCAGGLWAQHSETALTNPFRTPDDRARGGAFFRSQCASCHGIDGKGGASGPNLAAGNFRHASNDEGLFRVITKGVAGTSMPGFSMNGREIWQIVAFIRGLNTGRAAGATPGDARAGEQLFQSNRCLQCHWLNGAGSSLGLDLSSVATRLTAIELRQALIDPSAEVAPEYWIWTAVTKDGQKLRGSRFNEDTFSLQILDSAGRLRSVAKADLREQTLDRRSPMPSFKDKLSETQLNDLVSYLNTLQGAAK